MWILVLPLSFWLPDAVGDREAFPPPPETAFRGALRPAGRFRQPIPSRGIPRPSEAILVALRPASCTLKEMTTYIDEDLLRSAKVHAAQSDGKIYEVIDEALRRYLEDSGRRLVPLAGALAGRPSEHSPRRVPGVPRESATELREGDTLSDAVIAEREGRDY